MKNLVSFFVLMAAVAMLSPSVMAQSEGVIASDFNLCIVGGTLINDYPILDHIAGDIGAGVVITITTQPEGGEAVINSDQTLKLSPTSAFPGMVSVCTYTACNMAGFCDNGAITVTYADIESYTPPAPTIINIGTANVTATQMCVQGLGWILQNNCIPNLYTVCLTHNESLGTLTYINDDCINYVPTGITGTDTIRVVGCGDAPPPTFYTCNGPVTMSNCSETWYIVQVNGTVVSGTFTEVQDISCAEMGFAYGLGYPTWATATITDNAEHGMAEIIEGDVYQALQYIPFPGFVGSDTVVVACAHATQITCDTGIYVFNVSCNPSLYMQLNKSAICDSTSNLGDYVGTWGFTPEIMTPPQHGTAWVEGFTVYYTPVAGFTGIDTLYVYNVSGGPADEPINGLFIIDVTCHDALPPALGHIEGLSLTYPPDRRAALVALSSGTGVLENIVLFDLTGRKVKQQNSFETPQNAEIGFENLNTGIYLLYIQTDKGATALKLFIK